MKKIFLSLFLLFSILNGETVEQLVDRINEKHYEEAMYNEYFSKPEDWDYLFNSGTHNGDYIKVVNAFKFMDGTIDKYQYFGVMWCYLSSVSRYRSKHNDGRSYDFAGRECMKDQYLMPFVEFIRKNIKTKSLRVGTTDFHDMDPYNNVGTWIHFEGELIQRLNRKSGLFKYAGKVFCIENLPSNKSYVEGYTYHGIVRGGGEYQYTTSGRMNIVPKADKVFMIQ